MKLLKKGLEFFNFTYRLRTSVEDLTNSFSSNSLTPLRCPLPSEICDQNQWRVYDEEINNNNFIGHGFYWNEGNCETKDILGAGDYDNIELNYSYLTGCEVLAIDIELIKEDFSEVLKSLDIYKDSELVKKWFIDRVSYLSEGQINRMSKGGDLYGVFDYGKDSEGKTIEDISGRIDMQKKTFGVRYKGGGRATNFFIPNTQKFFSNINSNDIKNNSSDAKRLEVVLKSKLNERSGLREIDCPMVNVKGLGTEEIAVGFTSKENGLLSIVDAVKEYCYEKLFDQISKKEKAKWKTVKTYAIIDTNIRFKDNEVNKATSYKGEKCALVVRQCSGRLVSRPDEFAFYSVATQDIIQKHLQEFISSMQKYRISSEQLPRRLFEYVNSEEQQSTEQLELCDWNIQTDTTAHNLIDFSQYYCLPDSIVGDFFTMSWKAFIEAIICHRDANKFLLSNEKAQEVFSVGIGSDVENTSKKYKREEIVTELKGKYGDIVGRMNKSLFSWSWFLETDDSQVMSLASSIGELKGNIWEGITCLKEESNRDLHSFITRQINNNLNKLN